MVHNLHGSSSKLRAHATIFEEFMNSSLPVQEKSDGILTANAMTIWNAGFETVGFTLTFATYQVLRNPAIKTRLQNDIRAAWPNPATSPSLSALEKLPYLMAILKESMRLGSGVLTRLGRINEVESLQYGDWTIPPGTTVSMSLPLIHRNGDLFKDPLAFRPERWLEGDSSLEKHLVAFSRGSRGCIGEPLAWTELYLILGTFFRRFDGELVGTTEEDVVPYHDDFVAGPKNGVQKLMVIIEDLRRR